ncbi:MULTISPECIES: hypothetical protein [unclassified Streptomyces]|uniref:DNA polymerase III subunit beta family protein n=1 Tax=unclassified Streptomyces TaxID=2593676 RepID=UPI0034506955
MSVTLNAHQLGRLLERTAAHIGDETLPMLHGIRLEADATYLYAVATDRYTLAVARYRHHGLDCAPFDLTLPARALPALRRWLTCLPGHDPVTLTLTGHKARLVAPQGEMTLTIDDAQEYIDWRGLLRGIIKQTQDCDGTDAACPVLDTDKSMRFGAADTRLRIWTNPGRTATLLAGEDFLGAQMPMRTQENGFPTSLADDLDHLHSLWDDTLTGTPPGTAPVSGPPARSNVPGASRTVAGTTKDLLRQTMHSIRDLIEEDGNFPAALAAHAAAGATAWTAYRYLEALHRADPLLAAQTVAESAGELDSGELGEFAYDAAYAAGFNPQAWEDDTETATGPATPVTADAPVSGG